MPTNKPDDKTKPPRKGYLLIACDGEAHSNPYIDNCGLCAPRWGWLEVKRSPGVSGWTKVGDKWMKLVGVLNVSAEE